MNVIQTIVTASLALQVFVPAMGARISLNSHAKVTPIQKVLEMMAEALAKGKKEKNEEEVEFAKFKAFCEDTISDTTKSIEEGTAKIEQLTADILKAESDAKILAEEIAALEAEVATDEKDLADATAIRKKEKADYEASHTDYSESIDAIERAIAALKKREADIPQSLLQVQNSKILPARTKAIIQSFVEMQSHSDLSDSSFSLAPEANAYEFQSGGVVAMLEKLLTKFEDELFALEKAEMSLQANFEMLAQKLTRSIKDAKTDISMKTAAKAQRLEDAASAKGELEITTAAKAEDEKTLSDTKAECFARSDEYEKNQVTRAGEIEAITKAMEILASPAVSGNAGKHLPSLAQAGTSLIQVDVSQHNIDTRQRVVTFLQSKAQKIGSRYLLLVASRAAGDPFKKVKKMIKDMIVKLMEEANAEAEHKGFCDTELATNKQTRDMKSEKVDELTASIEEHTAEKEKLATEISELSAAIAELKKKQAEATALRDEEKQKNAIVIKDAQDGQAAVEMAIKVLKDFYEGAGGAAFLQNADMDMRQAMTEVNKEPYKPSADGGIMGMLEVILSDFARLEAETQAAEDSAQSEYERFMADADEDNAVKQTEVDHKTLAKQRCEEKLTELGKDLEVTQAELDAALDYYEKLKPDCVDMGLSYEDRVARRKEEIVSLQEALKILSGTDLA